MSAPDVSSLAVALLWKHYRETEREHLSLEEMQAQVRHVERCLLDAAKLVAQATELWRSSRKDAQPIPREDELYRQVVVAAIRGRVSW